MMQLLFALTTLLSGWCWDDTTNDAARNSGVKGGLVLILGCEDEDPVSGLKTGTVVQYLDPDPIKVAEMRSRIMKEGKYGRVSAVAYKGKTLPYVSNLINLVILRNDALQYPIDEIDRILAPRGLFLARRQSAMGDRKSEQIGKWFAYRKTVPDSIDDWTHQLYNASNNGISKDTVVAPPESMQWLAGPPFTRHHGADKGTSPAVRPVISASGRLYYIIDTTSSSNMTASSKWVLLARDAFSGIELWRTPLKSQVYQKKIEQLWRSIVADDVNGGRVYAIMGSGEPLSQIDGSSGKVIRRYEGTEEATEFIKDGERIFLVTGSGMILTFHSESGKKLWSWKQEEGDPMFPLTMAASGEMVAVKTDKSVVCLSAEEGKTLWRKELQPAKVLKRYKYAHEKLLIHDGVVLASFAGDDASVLYRDNKEFLGSHPRVRDYKGKMAALSARDGKILWTAPYLPSIDDGSPGEIYVQDGRILLGPDFSISRDLKTGKEVKGRNIIEGLWTTGHHYRCYPGKATANYIITAKRGVEMIHIKGDKHSRNNWVRGTCRIGVTPANGFLYCPSHSCGCYMEAKLWGFWALAGKRPARKQETAEDKLQKGPAYGKPGNFQPAIGNAEAWATYRGNNARGGSSATDLHVGPDPSWTSDLGGRLGAVTCADEKVFVVQVDAHTVHALNASDGKRLWKFTAAARIDSPPTFHKGLLLFGSRDGFVYCLRASDGEPAWKFLAAPSRITTVAYEQLESLWPVHGSVLVEDNVAYVAAGRSSYLDGGIMLYGLEPATGKVLSSRLLVHKHTGYTEPPENAEEMKKTIKQNWLDYKTTQEPDGSDSFAMHGALTDIMSSDGDSLFMRQMRFDAKLATLKTRRQHLFGTSSLLDGQEFNRTYWALGTGDFHRTPVSYPWIVAKAMVVPYGLMLCFDDKTVWGVRRENPKKPNDVYFVYAMSRPDPSSKQTALPDFGQGGASAKRPKPAWKQPLSFRPRAMIRCGKILVIGGGSKEKGAFLHLASSETGELLEKVPIASTPVWDGMAAAYQRLFVPMENGSVCCYKGK